MCKVECCQQFSLGGACVLISGSANDVREGDVKSNKGFLSLISSDCLRVTVHIRGGSWSGNMVSDCDTSSLGLIHGSDSVDFYR